MVVNYEKAIKIDMGRDFVRKDYPIGKNIDVLRWSIGDVETLDIFSPAKIFPWMKK